jgi:UPF0755 protein
VRRFLLLSCIFIVVAGAALFWWVDRRPLPLREQPYAFTVKSGASLRSVARELTAAGVLPGEWPLVGLGRWRGVDRSIKAGNYEIAGGTTLVELLERLTQGDVNQTGFIIVEGWTFRQFRQALHDEQGIAQTLADVPDAELMRRIGGGDAAPEGQFFPDTYYFVKGDTDVSLLKRSYRTMQQRLATAWAARSPGLPLTSPYQALVLASIVEKETGQPADRPLIASVFINRLRQGMRLQTDPAVIYGLAQFDGNLRKRDLESDQPFNTYTRDGLPPTPIALPGQASLDAVLHPPATPYLYFVARGDGSSEFSTDLADHNRAVAKYQRERR